MFQLGVFQIIDCQMHINKHWYQVYIFKILLFSSTSLHFIDN